MKYLVARKSPSASWLYVSADVSRAITPAVIATTQTGGGEFVHGMNTARTRASKIAEGRHSSWIPGDCLSVLRWGVKAS